MLTQIQGSEGFWSRRAALRKRSGRRSAPIRVEALEARFLLTGDTTQTSWIIPWPNGFVPTSDTAVASLDLTRTGVTTIATVAVQAGDRPSRLFAAGDAVAATAPPSVVPLPAAWPIPKAPTFALEGQLDVTGSGDLYEVDVSGKTASLAVTLTLPQGATTAPSKLVITDAEGHPVVEQAIAAHAGAVTVSLDGITGPPGATLIIGVLPPHLNSGLGSGSGSGAGPGAGANGTPAPGAAAPIPYSLQILRSQAESENISLTAGVGTFSQGVSSPGPFNLFVPPALGDVPPPTSAPPPPQQGHSSGSPGTPNPLTGQTQTPSSPGPTGTGQGPAKGTVVTPPLPVVGPDAVAGMLAFEGPAPPVNPALAAQVDLALVDLTPGRSASGRFDDLVAVAAAPSAPAQALNGLAQALPALSVALNLPMGAAAAPILALPWASAGLGDPNAGAGATSGGPQDRPAHEPVLHASRAELPPLAALGLNRPTWETEIALAEAEAQGGTATATTPAASRGLLAGVRTPGSPVRGSLRTTVALAVTSTGAMVMGLLGPDLAIALRTATTARFHRRRLLFPWSPRRQPERD